jgi:hypothetical protein
MVLRKRRILRMDGPKFKVPEEENERKDEGQAKYTTCTMSLTYIRAISFH